MVDTLKRARVSFLLASVVYVILGLVLLIWPGVGGVALCRLLGAALLLFGIIAAATGLFFLLQPLAVFSILSMVMGVYVIIDSLVALNRVRALYRMEYPYWWVSLLLTILGVVLGAVLLWRPFVAAEAVAMLIGAVFLFLGLADLWSIWKLSRLTKALRETLPIEVDPLDLE